MYLKGTSSLELLRQRLYPTMKSSTILAFLLAVVVFTDAQNLDAIDVETRDNPSAYLRQKRQLFMPQAAVPQTVAPQQVPVPMAPNFLLPSSGCFWSGTAPFCIAACGKNFHSVLTDIRGDGKRCWTGFKKRCCPIPSGMIKIKDNFSL